MLEYRVASLFTVLSYCLKYQYTGNQTTGTRARALTNDLFENHVILFGEKSKELSNNYETVS